MRLELITRGRRTGREHRTLLTYARYRTSGDEHEKEGGAGDDGATERYLVAASNRGADRHPDWYLNVVAKPSVGVHLDGVTRAGEARTATPAERPALWRRMVELMPSYQDYQEAARREIPVVVITVRRCGPGPAGAQAGGTGRG